MASRLIKAILVAVSCIVGVNTLCADDMTFDLIQRGNDVIVVAQGTITADSPRQFQAMLEGANGDVDMVCFNSGGGDLQGGMMLGAMIRTAGLSTSACEFLTGRVECASACTLAAIGGTVRYFVGGQLGVHQLSVRSRDGSPYLEENSVLEKKMIPILVEYSDLMGIKTNFVMKSLSEGPDNLYYLSDHDLEKMAISDTHLSRLFYQQMAAQSQG